MQNIFQLLCLVLVVACVHRSSETCTQLPIRLPARVVPSPPDLCASDADRESTLDQLDADLDTIISEHLQVFQSLSLPVQCPGSGWVRVADFNLEENSDAQCPEGWVKTADAVPHCRLVNGEACGSMLFNEDSLSFSQVCGRIKGYQVGKTAGFFPSTQTQDGLDGAYLDGVSITRGTPREHVWSFASGYSSSRGEAFHRCPCANVSLSGSTQAPAYVGNNSFCDSGTDEEASFGTFYSDNALWDGQGCRAGNRCCLGAPYFNADLVQATCDPLEVRLCSNVDERVNVGVSIIELYVK